MPHRNLLTQFQTVLNGRERKTTEIADKMKKNKSNSFSTSDATEHDQIIIRLVGSVTVQLSPTADMSTGQAALVDHTNLYVH